MTRTSPAKGAEQFLALAVIHGEHTEHGHRLYHRLYHRLTTATTAPTPGTSSARSPPEATAGPHGKRSCAPSRSSSASGVHHQPQPWRRPGERDRGYLTALTGWGYQPSDVGQLVLAEPSTKGDTEPGDTEPDAEAEWADGHRTWSWMDREEGGAPGVRGTRPSTGCCATKRTPAAETGRGAGHLRPAVTVHVRVRPEGRRPIGLIGALSVRIEGSGPARPELSQRAQTTSAWRPRTVTTSATTGWPPPVTRSPWSTGARWK